MSKPSSLKYPRDAIKKAEASLRKKLHKVIGDVMNGELTKAEGRDKGNIILEEQYTDQIEIINAFVKSKGLAGVTGFETPPYDARTEAKDRWKRIIEDIQL